MNRLTRYMFRQSFGVMLFVMIGLTAAAWLIQSLKLIEMVVDHGVGLEVFLSLAVLSLPQLLALVIPIACFLGVLFTYNKLIGDSELVVMRACGLSQGMLARPAILQGLAGTAVMLSLTLYFLPASKNGFKDLQFNIRNQFTSGLLQEGSFNTVSDSLTVYVRARDAAGRLQGLLIQDTRNKAQPVTLTAENGAIISVNGVPRVLMVNGTKESWDIAKRQLTVLTFDQSTLDLNDFRDAPGARLMQPDERFLPDLFNPQDEGLDAGFRLRLLVEGNNRFISPFYCLTFVMIALACLLTGEINRRGHSRRLLLSYASVALIEAISLGVTNLANRQAHAIILMYLSLILPLAISTFLILRGTLIRRRPNRLGTIQTPARETLSTRA